PCPSRQIPSAPCASPPSATLPHASNPRRASQDGSAAPLPSPSPSAISRDLREPTPVFARLASQFLRLCRQNPRNHFRHPVPLLLFALQPLLPIRRQPVILRFPLVLRFAPFGGNPALILQPVERRVQRTLLDLEPPARNLLDPQQHSVSVQ